MGTLVATWFCGGAVTGATSETYSWGLQGIIWDPLSSVSAFILVGFLFVRMFRRARYLTPADMFMSRFGKVAGAANAGVVSLCAELIWLGSVLVAFGAVISMFTGMSLTMAIAIACVVTCVYTYLGCISLGKKYSAGNQAQCYRQANAFLDKGNGASGNSCRSPHCFACPNNLLANVYGLRTHTCCSICS